MKIDYLYAAMIVANLEASTDFYARVLGRQPDDRPMDTLVQWRGFSDAGIQLFEDAAKAGRGVMTLVVADLDATAQALAAQDIALGRIQQGDFGRIAQLDDPDGNVITFAEPLAQGAG